MEDDKENKVETIVKVAILIWSAALLTLSYWEPPSGKKIVDFDPTFIASIFSASTASLGLSIGKKGNNNQTTQSPTINKETKK
tara:strand:+ start:641 stop:889 length:249 start_codon:yes stop_codon:yes gene_type:complete